MGSTYTRQSSAGIVDGGVIEASDLNDEFDQILAAFAVSTGHSHCLLYTSPSPRDRQKSRMPSSA